MIPYGRHSVTREDVEAVVEVLRSDFLTQGPVVPEFEGVVASIVGADHAVAVNSATSALHLACAGLGLGPGDELWTVPNTFVASANCGRYCGARVEFVDIDPLTWNMDVNHLEAMLKAARLQKRGPKVVVPVHFGGQPGHQQAIWALAKEFGFFVVEDASHSIGAEAAGEPVGSCRWSDVTVFSFHPVKIVTTGEGGMALTNDERLAATMRRLRTHGVTREPGELLGDETGAWYYEQRDLGWNYRMTDIQAALGRSQVNRLEDVVARRNSLARRYTERLQHCPLRLPALMANCTSSWHLYVVRVVAGEASRRKVFDGMRTAGIGVNVHYMPVHLQPYYRALGYGAGICPEAEAHGREALTLPLFPDLAEEEQDYVISTLAGLLDR